ncbi:MAG: Fe-Mn family superoxide dismutase [Acidobacteria bacterium]|nr:Fe-Mn family superoxide dismutase [Acidobacteriota bacterium]
MKNISRRGALGKMMAGGAGLALTNFPDLVAANPDANERGDEIMTTEGQTPGAAPTARAFGGQHQPKSLPFNPAKLNGFSEKLIRSHWENNYGGAVKALHNYWAWDHMHNAPMSRPLLVLDMYEHAYHIDYGAAAAKYVDAFAQNVNWEEVNRRAESSVKANLA